MRFLTVFGSGKDSCFKVPSSPGRHVTMTANDTATRRVTTGIVLAVGLFAGSDSHSHIYTLARDHGQANLYYPLCFRDSSEIRRPEPAVPGPSVSALRVDATPAVRRTTAPTVRRGRSL
jgi:hypothetical protein